jgi:hypothetical protein
MTSIIEPDVAAALRSIPLLSDVHAMDVEIRRLGGLTNRNYYVGCAKGEFVLRLVGAGEGEKLDRTVEHHNLQIVSENGLTAELLHYDTQTGMMLTRYLKGSVTLNAARLAGDLGAVKRTGKSLRALHDCQPGFRGGFDVYQQIEDYLVDHRTRQVWIRR